MNDTARIDPQQAGDAGRGTAGEGAAPERTGGASRLVTGLALLIALAALALAAWQWRDGRIQTEALRQELAKRLADADAQTRASRVIVDQIREATNEAQVKIGVLENKFAESQNQQIALEALYQDLSRNRDEWTYAEIEQSLLIANQQLQLAGNVKAALIALQNADLRLQRMERPQLTPLRKAISHDIERLKALPYIDTVGISVRLDNLIAAIDGLPMAMEVRPLPTQESAAGQGAGGATWARLWREAWGELKQLVRIQNMDRPDVPLLEPSQVFFLHENLKLRLLSARLALLSHDETSYKADLKAARAWIERYYDMHDGGVIRAANTLRSLQANEISIELPDISDTLDALRNLRLARERSAR